MVTALRFSELRPHFEAWQRAAPLDPDNYMYEESWARSIAVAEQLNSAVPSLLSRIVAGENFCVLGDGVTEFRSRPDLWRVAADGSQEDRNGLLDLVDLMCDWFGDPGLGRQASSERIKVHFNPAIFRVQVQDAPEVVS